MDDSLGYLRSLQVKDVNLSMVTAPNDNRAFFAEDSHFNKLPGYRHFKRMDGCRPMDRVDVKTGSDVVNHDILLRMIHVNISTVLMGQFNER
jgi:hypothetical protein